MAPVGRLVRNLLRGGASAALVLAIMILGSFGLWLGTPLLWLWVGSQIDGSTDSLGAALAAMFAGVIVTIGAVAVLLSRLSDLYRRLQIAGGRPDPGHSVLESVLVVSAAVSIVVFGVWFLLFAGASPVPVGISL